MRLKVAAAQQYERDVKFYDTVQKAAKVVEAGGASEEKVKLAKLANFMEEPVKPDEVDMEGFEKLSSDVSDGAKESIIASAKSVAANRVLQDTTISAGYDERLKAIANMPDSTSVDELVNEAKRLLLE